MTITATKHDFIISFNFHAGIIADVKAIDGRWFDRESRAWHVPASESEAVENLRRKYHYLVPSTTMQASEFIGNIPDLPELKIDIPLKRNLFAYQRKGVARSMELKRFINGDEPGLGKTGQAIATLHGAALRGEQTFPCLIICPKSLKENWAREWAIWTDRKAIVLRDSMRNTWSQYLRTGLADVLIVNYESLKKYFVASINKPDDAALSLKYVKFKEPINLFKSVVIDELHKCKDNGTQQSKFTKGLSSGKEWILGLTGTPVVNKPKDLISQLAIIDRLGDIGGYKFFMNRYCGGNGSGATNLKELQYRLATTCFFQRQKKDVLTDLPDKMRQIILCDITTQKEYQDAIKDLSNYLRDYKSKTESEVEKSMRGEIMVKIGICKNISARGKLNEVTEYVNEVIESGQKIVVFIHQKEIAEALLKIYPHAVTIRGSDSTDARQSNVDRFQKDPKCNIIICNIKAGGVGITLTASSRVAFVELPWHAADANQCEDRCHRIGQKGSVQCTYFLGGGTIDEDIYKIIEKKREVANSITGSEDDVQKEIIDRIAESLFNTKA
jgi:SWI/SNF-related matrix-associated actin-dependent regulator 1 of chromatin subfamily A